jgi:hypothetical protein
MLRLYKPIIEHDIFGLHKTLKHLVCEVWCRADENTFQSKINTDLQKLLSYSVKTGATFGNEAERIYEIFQEALSPIEIFKISSAFTRSEKIEELCSKILPPIYLSELHEVVEKDIKPLFKWCYEELLDKKKVAGDKLAYYKELITKNDFQYCACCGLIDFESTDPDNEVREAYDHYLPKSEYPFASVNFKNLVPLCYKCNSARKKAKNPIENDRIAFYPFSKDEHSIGIKCKFIIETNPNLDVVLTNLEVSFSGDEKRIDTWNWLFDIKDQYARKIADNSKNVLRDLKSRHRLAKKKNSATTYEEILQDEIEICEDNKYSDWKFLKLPVLEELKLQKDLIAVYK